MITRNKIITVGVSAVAILVVGSLWFFGFVPGTDRALFRLIKDRPDLVSVFNDAMNREGDIKKFPKKEAAFMLGLAQDFKTIGELVGDPGKQKIFFKKSLSVYEDGIKKFGSQNIIFYLNGGKVAERLPDYILAEKYYKKAIEISSGDDSGYTSLAELYEYRMKKPKEEIVKVFDTALKNQAIPAPILQARGSYLRRAGDYAGALESYTQLSRMFPDYQSFKTIIAELQAELNKK